MLNFFLVSAFFIPVVSAFFCAVLSRVAHKIFVQFFSLSTVVFLTGFSLYAFFSFDAPYVVKLMPWISIDDLALDWSINVDRLTLCMFCVVSIVSLVVRIYSFGYMAHDPGRLRFFSYLSLFAFAMLLLVASDNFLQLFLGWEGVGVCSYLLIGFWYEKESANNASIKAFVVNRVGDVFLIIAIAAIYNVFGSLKFIEVFSNLDVHKNDVIFGFDAISFICFFLFLGCMGKSAQIGLHVWLPDAMEGPTPVSALIHAATMVTAGIFLVARCSPMFDLAISVREFILSIGCITALFAGSIALFSDDIKKIIAYSTCSQLGYMFIACGVGNYSAAMFHLITHAFFKALLFLAAGSVIHGNDSEQNIHSMAADLWRKMPFTYVMFWIGSLALAGIFPFSGFYSKDLIIESVYSVGYAFDATLIGALLTSIYSWRLIFVVFHSGKNSSIIPHESPFVMLLPLGILSIFSVFSGFLIEHYLHINSLDFWDESIVDFIYAEINGWKKFIPLFCAFCGILLAFILRPWFIGNELSKTRLCLFMGLLCGVLLVIDFYLIFIIPLAFFMRKSKNVVFNLLRNKYYIDEIYDIFFVKPLRLLSNFLWFRVDTRSIDVVPNNIAIFARFVGNRIFYLHNGYLYSYIFMIIFGLAVMVLWADFLKVIHLFFS